MNVKLYLNYHDSFKIVENDILTPIHVGKKVSNKELNMIADDSGDNISDKNRTFCELTSQYWVWKNVKDLDYVGFFHYRRMLNFSDIKYPLDQWGVSNYDKVDNDIYKTYGLDTETIISKIDGYDIIFPSKWNVKRSGSKNLKDHFIKGLGENCEKALDLVVEIINNKHPEYSRSVNEVFESEEGYFTNIFISKFNLFEEYSEWLFDILFETEKRLDIRFFTKYEARIFGFLSEWLFNIYWNFRLKNDKLTYKELDRFFIKNPGKETIPIKKPKVENIISIAIATDNNYVPHVSALITSIINNTNGDNFLDIIIIDDAIDQMHKAHLEGIVIESGCNGSLRFLPTDDTYDDVEVHMHFSKATFCRLSLPSMLYDYDKILYIDADTIVNDDIEDLYRIELGDNYLAAVRDIIMHMFVAEKIPSKEDAGSLPSGKYLTEYLGFKNEQIMDYFQAGVLLMNLKKMREDNVEDKFYSTLSKKKYWFLDQDVLNVVCKNRVVFLDMKWNYVNLLKKDTEKLVYSDFYEYIRYEKTPSIIHYAGYEVKPWITVNARYAEFYWKFLRLTPYYEGVFSSAVNRSKNYAGNGALENDVVKIIESDTFKNALSSGKIYAFFRDRFPASLRMNIKKKYRRGRK